jgi:hypothetical protein
MEARMQLALRLALGLALCSTCCLAKDNGQWEGSDPKIRQWYQQLMQPDNPRVSCCGEADAFEADTYQAEGDHYVAVITDGKGKIPNGTKFPVPNHKMKWMTGTRPVTASSSSACWDKYFVTSHQGECSHERVT